MKVEITLRDYFAGMALQGMLSNRRTTKSLETLQQTIDIEKQISLAVYKMADAMIKQRDK